MKKVNKVEATTQMQGGEDSGMYQNLLVLESEIKDPKTRKGGYQALLEIDTDELSVPEEIFYLYIRGKYWTKLYRESSEKKVELLEMAHDYFSEMSDAARSGNLTIRSPRILFLKAHTTYLIGVHHKSLKVRESFISKAKFLAKISVKNYPENKSFVWLKAELENH